MHSQAHTRITAGVHHNPEQIALDADGMCFIAQNNRVLKETPSGSGYCPIHDRYRAQYAPGSRGWWSGNTLSVTFTPTDTTHYITTTAMTGITITPAAPSLSFAPIASQVFGAAPLP
jgi:hypothetical protein